MAALTGTMYCTPSRPSGISSVSAASGPYAAELRASSPKTGIPASGPMCSARSSLVASGRPNNRLKKRCVYAHERTSGGLGFNAGKAADASVSWSGLGGRGRQRLNRSTEPQNREIT